MSKNLSEHFSLKDIECKCGCGQAFFYPELIRLAEIVAKELDLIPVITSANRCRKHNTRVGGSPTSLHVIGAAFDITFLDKKYRQSEKIINLSDAIMSLREKGVITGGLGLYKKSNFIHLDLGRFRYWEG